MPTDRISYSETNYFSSLIIDYLSQKTELRGFYNRFPKLEEFKGQMEEKKTAFPPEVRKTLVGVLQKQYEKLEASKETKQNLELLSRENTFTVTTGHQLNLFTGPLYFIYKILSTINLASQLKAAHPDSDFVPVYWMATEDHDFAEINFFNLHGKKFTWNPSSDQNKGGAVGEMGTEGLKEVFDLFSKEVGTGTNAQDLKDLFQKGYLEHPNLAEATRYIANELFKEYGLVILDAHDKELKSHFVPYMEQELVEQVAHKSISPKAGELQELGYGVQVNPREINLFYLGDGKRERVLEKEGHYYLHGTKTQWSRKEILQLLQENPERFSPNVSMRPLYQEVILPNLCYIGGGGEIAYWLELKEYFDTMKVPFPILMLRNSALIQSARQREKIKKLHITPKELFLRQHELINRKVRQISDIDIDLSPQKEFLKQHFRGLYEISQKTDPSFVGAVKAQEVKQLKGMENLEKRLLKAQKRKLKDEVTRITELQNQLFPGKGLQERHQNFSEFYLEYGREFLSVLKKELDPFEQEFKIITL